MRDFLCVIILKGTSIHSALVFKSYYCPNPLKSGTTHTVDERDLRPATQLERAKRRKKFQSAMVQGSGAAGPSSAAVFDVEE